MKRFKRTVALTCAFCFFAVFLLSSTLLIVHATHDHEPVTICQRTLLPECKCENPLAPVQPLTQANEDSGSHMECTVCLAINKTSDQIRQQFIVVNGTVHTDLSLLITTMFGLLIALSGTGTPVMLKTRINN